MEKSPRLSQEEMARVLSEPKIGERIKFEVPKSAHQELILQLSKIAPDTMSLHNTFIALEGSTKDKKTGDIHEKFSAESNAMTTEDYLSEGRGQENIRAAGEYDVANSYAEQLRKGAEYRRQQAEAKQQADKGLSLLSHLGTALELGLEASRRLGAQVEAFSSRIEGAVSSSMELMMAANDRLFASLRPAEQATPGQRERFSQAQQAHELASQLERAL